MAEATAVVGLVASIASLIDVGAKVTERIHESIAQTSDVPESFAALSTRLPLLSTSLRQISNQAQAGQLPRDVVNAFQALITSASHRVTVLQTSLSTILPPEDASQVQRATKELNSLAKEKEIQATVQKIHQDIDFLVLHQTTQHVDTSERILETLAKLQLGPSPAATATAVAASSSSLPQGHHFPSISAHDQSNVHLGDVYHIDYHTPEQVRSLGLCLSSAPVIDKSNFIGRALELNVMQDVLQPDEPSTQQRRVVLGGIGGIGKTQLAIAYARRHQDSYSSVLWLNATSEATLYASFRTVARGLVAAETLAKLNDNQILAQVLEWLSRSQNTQWLLIFDNYDDPDQFQIESFYPNIGHGSIIITTRLPDLVTDQAVRVQPLQDIDDSLAILKTRSGRRNTKEDLGARRLVERLGGLPLALVTAGAYLRRSTLTFQQYLDIYEQHWQTDTRRPLRLHEYRDRTLYTTWNLTYHRLESDDPDAACVLKLLAFFDNQEVWYTLLQATELDLSPGWLRTILAEHTGFESVMRTLVEYCLVEVQHANQSYSMHSCVHDWTLGELNRELDLRLYWYAFDSVAASIEKLDSDKLGYVQNTCLSRHALRLTHPRFWTSINLEDGFSSRLNKAEWIADMLKDQVQLTAAEQVYKRALAGYEKAFGPNHGMTLNAINNLGLMYFARDKLDEAEQMYKRALAGYEKTLGLDRPETIRVVSNLGDFYANQGKLKEAEQLYKRALASREKALGPDHITTLKIVQCLGHLYFDQGKLDEAEQMYKRVLVGREKIFGPDHISTLNTVNNLGTLYYDQSKPDEAAQMFERALAGQTKALGPDHTTTLITVHNLALLYFDQGKLDEAEQMYKRALAGQEQALGPNHTMTLNTVNNLGDLYSDQGKLEEAEQLYKRALAGREKTLGPEHPSTLNSVHCLGVLYYDQDQLEEAEQMYQRALAGYVKVLEPEHLTTIIVVTNIGRLYEEQDRLDEAESMYRRALAVRQRRLGSGHPKTQKVAEYLERLCRQRR